MANVVRREVAAAAEAVVAARLASVVEAAGKYDCRASRQAAAARFVFPAVAGRFAHPVAARKFVCRASCRPEPEAKSECPVPEAKSECPAPGAR